MKLKHYKNLTPLKWKEFPFYKQILMIGSEIMRAGKWIEKKDIEEVRDCYERALELLYLTIETCEEKKRLREILIFKEALLSLYLKPEIKENKNLLKILFLMTKETEFLIEK
jgi:hypothetical protein